MEIAFDFTFSLDRNQISSLIGMLLIITKVWCLRLRATKQTTFCLTAAFYVSFLRLLGKFTHNLVHRLGLELYGLAFWLNSLLVAD